MDQLTDNHLLSRMGFDNPWWNFGPGTEVRFRHPPKRSFFQAFAAHIKDQGRAGALVLAGPRRAGKTVMIRQMIADLIEDGVDPASVLYVGFSTPTFAATRLDQLFGLFCQRHDHRPDQELYVFFDEAQYSHDWAAALSALAKALPRTRFVAAVSSGAPEDTSADDQAGLSVFVLPPLTFLEFLRFRGSEVKLFGPGANKPGGRAVFRESEMALLNAEFHRYVNFGGFPEGIMQRTEGAPAPTFIRDGLLERVLHKDLAGLAGINDTGELNRLFIELALNTAAEVSIEGLAGAIGIAKNTVRKYLDYLERAHLIQRVERVDGNARRFQRAVAFKVYLSSPCLYAALFGPASQSADIFSRLAETALIGQWPVNDADTLAYGSWRRGRIDLMTLEGNTGAPTRVFEMDWNNSYGGPGRGPGHLVKFIKGSNPDAAASILTRTIARPGTMKGVNITLVPVSLYCYLLQRNQDVAGS